MRHTRKHILAALLLTYAFIGGGFSGNPSKPALIVTLTDLSKSTADTDVRQVYQKNIDRILKSADAGDSLHFGWITTASVAQLRGVRVGLPKTPSGLFASRFDKKDARKKRKAVRAQARRKIQTYLTDTSRASKSTDIMSALHWAGQILARSDRTKKILVVQSDMIEEASYDFASQSFMNGQKNGGQAQKIISAEKKLGRLPDLSGVRVHVVGAGTASKNSRRIFQVRKFWMRYFQAAGASIKTYGGHLPRLR